MRYSRVGRRSCCCVCQAVAVVINASRRAMTAYGFPRRRDAIGVALAAVKLGLQAAAVSAAVQLKFITPRAKQ